MTEQALSNPCVCFASTFRQEVPEHFRMLSAIPNQKIYRCQNCQAFLSYHEQRRCWEVLLPGTGDQHNKSLF